MVRLALYQPDIPQNTGTILRMGACLGVGVDVIGPAGFDLSDKALRRAGMDYLKDVELKRHMSFAAFQASLRIGNRRLVLATTRAATGFCDFRFEVSDTLLFGRESAGVPDDVHSVADARIAIPMRAGQRSMNIALSAAMILGEALRQTDGFGSLSDETAGPE